MSTLLGALVGGAATFGGVVLAQRGADRRETEKAAKEALDRALISARILQGELAWAESRVQQALKTGKYWSARYGLKEDAWLQYREQIAVALDSAADWSRVRDGFRSLRTLELQASKRRTDDKSKVEVSEWGMKELRYGLRRIQTAISTLQPLAKDRPREHLGHDPGLPEAEPAISQEKAPPEPA